MPMPIARRRSSLEPAVVLRYRPIHPVVSDASVAVPRSIIAWAEKCDRFVLGDPAAGTNAALPASNIALMRAICGWSPKVELSPSADASGMATPGRSVWRVESPSGDTNDRPSAAPRRKISTMMRSVVDVTVVAVARSNSALGRR